MENQSKRGRPIKPTGKRVILVKSLITQPEASALYSAAESAGLSVSQFTRQAVLAAMQSIPKKTRKRNDSVSF